MKPAQLKLYWAEWNAARRALIATGAYSPAEADNMREEIHLRDAGRFCSCKELTQAELDRVLASFRALSRPDDLSVQLHQSTDARRRRQLIWGIQHDMPSDEWVQSIADDIYGGRKWRTLPLDDLLKLRRRVANHARKHPAA